MFQRLYDWTISLAESPRATWALAGIAFAESSFFPLPPDLILIPMAIARPRKAWTYAAVCTVASVTPVAFTVPAVLPTCTTRSPAANTAAWVTRE